MSDKKNNIDLWHEHLKNQNKKQEKIDAQEWWNNLTQNQKDTILSVEGLQGILQTYDITSLYLAYKN